MPRRLTIAEIAGRIINRPWRVQQINGWRRTHEGTRRFRVNYASCNYRHDIWAEMQMLLLGYAWFWNRQQPYRRSVVFSRSWRGRRRRMVNMVRVSWFNEVWVDEAELESCDELIRDFMAGEPEEIEEMVPVLAQPVAQPEPIAQEQPNHEDVQAEPMEVVIGEPVAVEPVEFNPEANEPRARRARPIRSGQNLKRVLLVRYFDDQE